jgi:hypothetical protein
MDPARPEKAGFQKKKRQRRIEPARPFLLSLRKEDATPPCA